MFRSMAVSFALAAATVSHAHTIPWLTIDKNSTYVFFGRGVVSAAGVQCLDEYYPDGCGTTGLLNLDSVPLPNFNVGEVLDITIRGSRSAGFNAEITEISSNYTISLPWTSDSYLSDDAIYIQDYWFNGWMYNGVILDRQTFSGSISFEFFPGNAGLWGEGSFSLFRSNWRLNSYSIDGQLYAVPEPASWAMMIIGLGAVGGAVRHRRQIGAQA